MTVPTDVHCYISDCSHCMQLQGWLVQHGGVVEGLTAWASSSKPWHVWLLLLPVQQLTQLRSLDLTRVRAQSPLQLPVPGLTTLYTTSSSGKRRGLLNYDHLAYMVHTVLERRLIQVDTFTAKRYSLHWINWVRPRHTHTRKPAKDTAHKTILEKRFCGFFFMFFCSCQSTQTMSVTWHVCGNCRTYWV
jgi:hypothetical protein